MSERRLVDANLIVSYLTNDHPERADVTDRLLEDCEHGKLTLVMLTSVVAECVYVLSRFYKQDRVKIASLLTEFLTMPGVETDELRSCLDALDRYAARRIDFVDGLLAAEAAATGLAVATFDTDFRHFPEVTVNVDPVAG